MPNISIQYLSFVAPEYANIDSERFNALQQIATEFVNDDIFGSKADYAKALYIAHMLKFSEMQGQGIAGPVVSEKVGDISRSYANQSYSTYGLESTNYGKQYLMVRRSVIKRPII